MEHSLASQLCKTLGIEENFQSEKEMLTLVYINDNSSSTTNLVGKVGHLLFQLIEQKTINFLLG